MDSIFRLMSSHEKVTYADWVMGFIKAAFAYMNVKNQVGARKYCKTSFYFLIRGHCIF